MKYLLDTNILLRLIDFEPWQHDEAANALLDLRNQECVFFIMLQNVSEFWNVCIRPKDQNGLGLTINETNDHLARFERLFTVVPDTIEVYKN